MIKGNLFGKSLKQFFIILLISCFILLGSSFVSAGYTRQIGVYGYNPYLQSYDVNLTSAGNPLTQNLGYTKQLFYMYDYLDEYVNYKTFWFWHGGLPYVYLFSNYHRYGDEIYFNQGNITNYYTCNEIIDLSDSMPLNCVNNNVGESTVDIFGNFLSSLTSDDYYYFESDTTSTSNIGFDFCISNHYWGKSLCFSPRIQSSFTGSLNFDRNASFDNINTSFLQNPPGYNGDGGDFDIGDGGIVLDSDESAINYFEKNYGWDSSICYVGVDSLDYLWGSSVSFQQGGGLSIFQAFSGLYGNSDLDKVYVWVNTQLINYEQWFNRESPLYLASYNSGSNHVDLYYENLTFPFSNKPVALYFMADYITSKSPYSTMGSEVVSYCNIKIKGGSYDDIIDEAVKNNINAYTQQSNINKGLNYNGTKKQFMDGFTGGISFTGNIGSYTGMTWEDFQHSGNVNPKNFFDGALSEMKSAMNNMQNPFTGVLPNYIIWGLLFFALFKLLRK